MVSVDGETGDTAPRWGGTMETDTMTQPSIRTLISRLERVEVSSRYAPDTRRMMERERMALVLAARSGDGAAIRAAVAEALRVMDMWDVPVDGRTARRCETAD